MDNLMLRRRLMMAAQGVWTTVTATTPFSVQNALKSKMQSLIQYGKMVQDGTPTPDAPVYPSVNNGAVQMVDDELPAGYKRLTGITFDGNFHYRTGEYLTSDDVVTMTLNNISTSGKNVFGSYNGANGKNFSLYIYGSTSGSYFRFGDVLKRPVYGGTGRRTITFGAGGTSGFAEDVSIKPDEFTTPANTYIGMLPNSSSAAYTGDIVGSILVGTRLEWIPCESDGGVIGYYERVNGNFIAPTGSGTPVSLGYDNSHLVPRGVGDTEVLTVGHDLVVGATYGGFIRAGNPTAEKPRGSVQLTSGWCYTGFIPVQPETAYRTVTQAYEPATGAGICYYEDDTAESCLGGVTCQRQGGEVFEFETPENCHYVRFSWKSRDTNDGQMYLLSEIQTATVPNLFAVGDYADEVDVVSGPVTRRVKRYIFDGTENWTQPSGADYFRLDEMFTDAISYSSDNPAIVCTHFVGRQSKVSASNMADGEIKLGYTSAYNRLYLKYAAMANVAALKAFFAAQYAAGTPVIVWYPLATPVTESITPQELSTVKGSNVIDATSDIAPFDVSVTYRARK